MTNRCLISVANPQNVRLLFLSSIFASVHIVSTLVANDHIELFRPVRHAICPLWNVWLQLVLGVAPWFVILAWRWILLGRAYGLLKRRAIAWGSCLGIVLPIFFLAVAITASGGGRYNSTVGTCITLVGWKIGILFWVIVATTILLAIAFTVSRGISIESARRGYSSDPINEHGPIRDIVIVGVAILVAYACINFLGLFSFSIWRSLATSLVPSLHLFSKLRIIGVDLALSIFRDSRWVEHRQALMMNDLGCEGLGPSDFSSFDDLRAYSRPSVALDDEDEPGLKDMRLGRALSNRSARNLGEAFLSWCTYQEIRPDMITVLGYRLSGNPITGGMNLAQWLVESIRQLDQWEKLYDERVGGVNQSLYKDYVSQYVKDSPLDVPDYIVNRHTKDRYGNVLEENSAGYRAPSLRQEHEDAYPWSKSCFFDVKRFHIGILEKLFFHTFKTQRLREFLEDDWNLTRVGVELVE